jgi:hypothetical protein
MILSHSVDNGSIVLISVLRSMPNVRNFVYGGCVAIALAAGIPSTTANAADMPVYKCRQANGAIAYQDYPCKGGSVVDIKPDAADPAAIARLERAQSEFNRSAAARAELALRQEELGLRRRELEASRAPYDAGAPAPYSGYYSGYTGYPGYLYDYGIPYVTKPPRVTHHQSGDRRRPQGRVPAVIRLPQRG